VAGPGNVSITSPLSTVVVAGTNSNPTVDINFVSPAVTEGIQDVVGPIVAGTGLFVYDDALNKFSLPSGVSTGQIPSANASGTVTWVNPATPIFDIVLNGPSDDDPSTPLTIQLTQNSTPIGVAKPLTFLEDLNVSSPPVVTPTLRTSTVYGKNCVTNTPAWGTVVERLQFSNVTTSGLIDVDSASVFIVSGGANFTLASATSCGANHMWIKNVSGALLILTPVVGTIDGDTSFTIPASGGIGSPPAGHPAYHFTFDGSNWWVI
jgi:hypothetical protein